MDIQQRRNIETSDGGDVIFFCDRSHDIPDLRRNSHLNLVGPVTGLRARHRAHPVIIIPARLSQEGALLLASLKNHSGIAEIGAAGFLENKDGWHAGTAPLDVEGA